MGSTNQNIWRLISHDISIQRNLSRNLINNRALAKYLIQTYNLDTSMDAVISAIRRYETDRVFDIEDKRIMDVIKGADVSIKNNMASITIAMKPEEFLSLLKGIDVKNGGVKIITGSNGARLIVYKSVLDKVLTFIPKNKIVKIEDNLAQINIALKDRARKTKGVLARISNELSLHGVNMMEIIVEPPEFLIYVKQEDMLETHKVISYLV